MKFFSSHYYFFTIQAEALTEQLTEELSRIEDELDSAESNLSNLQGRYQEAEKNADESDRARKELSNRGKVDDSKLNRLTAENEDLNEQIQLTTEKLNDVCILPTYIFAN